MGDLIEVIVRQKESRFEEKHPTYVVHKVEYLGADYGSGTGEAIEAELRASGPVDGVWAVLLNQRWTDSMGNPTTEFYGLIHKEEDIARETHRYAVQFGQELARQRQAKFTDQVPLETETTS